MISPMQFAAKAFAMNYDKKFEFDAEHFDHRSRSLITMKISENGKKLLYNDWHKKYFILEKKTGPTGLKLVSGFPCWVS